MRAMFVPKAPPVRESEKTECPKGLSQASNFVLELGGVDCKVAANHEQGNESQIPCGMPPRLCRRKGMARARCGNGVTRKPQRVSCKNDRPIITD